MLSFNQNLKDEIIAEIIKHREQDQVIQGTYGKEIDGKWKGCAVGCVIHSLNLKKGKNLSVSDHSIYETEFGIPRILARLEDRIFEGLSVENSKTWPENFMNAVPVNADLSLVWPIFAVWLLTDRENGVIQYAKNKEVIQKVSDLYSKVINCEIVHEEDLVKAYKSADAYAADAYADAAYAADAYAAAAYAADAVAYAASAADAVAYAADAASRKIYFKKMADKLIEILKETK